MSVMNQIISNVAFWTGLISVVLFAYNRFNVSLPDVDELSPPLLPSSFTTGFRFQLAAATYIAIYLFAYIALLVIGSFPQLQEPLTRLFGGLLGTTGSIGGDVKEPVGTPAWAAPVATAVMPSIPGFSTVDTKIRGHLQDFASIPSKARGLAREVLALIAPGEPPAFEDDQPVDAYLAAIKAHQERYRRLNELWSRLMDLDEGGVARRYARFRTTNQKMTEGFAQDFSGEPDSWKTAEAAKFIEFRYRKGVPRFARYIMCSMLEAENTELRVRTRLQRLGIAVRAMGINFAPGNVVLALVVVGLTTIIGSVLSGIIYYLAYRSPGGFVEFVHNNIIQFMLWALVSAFMYLPPILFAAGMSMYLFDRMSNESAIVQPTDRALIAVLTFSGSALLAFFPVLLFTVLQPATLSGRPPAISDAVPWVVAPAAVATTFMWLSTSKRNLADDTVMPVMAYIISHAGVALFASTIALLFWLSLGGNPNDYPNIPHNMAYFLVPIVAICLGASIGWVLSFTRRQLTPGGS